MAPRTIREFLDQLKAEVSAPVRSRDFPLEPRIVLVIDQFEEFFTLYGDTDRGVAQGQKNSYEVRERFFDELTGLVDTNVSNRTELVRLVVSIRDDYSARLSTLEARCGALLPAQKSAIPMLAGFDVPKVVRDPAEPFGLTFSDAAIDAIKSALLKENRFVLPIELQVVCERLWLDSRENGWTEITAERLASYGNGQNTAKEAVQAILDGYVAAVLDRMSDPLIQFDTFYVLSQLITPDGTREPLSYDGLMSRPLINKDVRREALDFLRDSAIVSVERRGQSGTLVELKHDFLVEPIRMLNSARRRSDPHWRPYLEARGDLNRAGLTDLGRRELAALAHYHRFIDADALRSKGLAERLFDFSATARYEWSKGKFAISDDPRRDWMCIWAQHFSEPSEDRAAAVASRLCRLAAGQAYRDYSTSKKLNFLSSCRFFLDQGAAEALLGIASADGGDEDLKITALRHLLRLDGDEEVLPPPAAGALDAALQMLGTGGSGLRAKTLLALTARCRADVVMNGVATSYPQALDRAILDLISTEDDVSHDAIVLLTQLLEHRADTPALATEALTLLAETPELRHSGLRARLGTPWVDAGLRDLAERGEWLTLGLLARDHGLSLPSGKAPQTVSWVRKGRGKSLWPLTPTHLGPTFMLGAVIAAVFSMLLLLIPGEQAPLDARLLYVVATSVLAGGLAVLGRMIFPPGYLFADRLWGLKHQTRQSALAALILAAALMSMLALLFEGPDAFQHPGFYIAVFTLFLAFWTVRPAAFMLTTLWHSLQVPFLAAVPVPFGILLLGAILGQTDGLAVEAHALYVGGPIAAGLLATFQRHDFSRGDRGLLRAGGPLWAQGALYAGVALTVVLGVGMAVRGIELRNPEPQQLAIWASQDQPVRFLLTQGDVQRFEVPYRQFVTQQTRASGGTTDWALQNAIDEVIATGRDEWADAPFQLEPGTYSICADQCLVSDGLGGDADGTSLRAGWRAYLDSFDLIARPDTLTAFGNPGQYRSTRFLPKGYSEIVFSWSDGAEFAEVGSGQVTDQESLEAFSEFIADLAERGPDDGPAVYLATEDVVLVEQGDLSNRLPLGVGSLILAENDGGNIRAALLGGVTRIGAPVDAGMTVTLAALPAALRPLRDDEIDEAIQVVEHFLPITIDRLHEREFLDTGWMFLEDLGLRQAAMQIRLQPAPPDDAIAGRLFFDFFDHGDLEDTDGGGVFEALPADAADGTVAAALLTGWNRVPSADLCYTFIDINSVMWLPEGDAGAAFRQQFAAAFADYAAALEEDDEGARDQWLARRAIWFERPDGWLPDQANCPIFQDFGLSRNQAYRLPEMLWDQDLALYAAFDLEIVLASRLAGGEWSLDVTDADTNNGSERMRFAERVSELDEQTDRVAICARHWSSSACEDLTRLTEIDDPAAQDALLTELDQLGRFQDTHGIMARVGWNDVEAQLEQTCRIVAFETAFRTRAPDADPVLYVAIDPVTGVDADGTERRFPRGSAFVEGDAGFLPLLVANGSVFTIQEDAERLLPINADAANALEPILSNYLQAVAASGNTGGAKETYLDPGLNFAFGLAPAEFASLRGLVSGEAEATHAFGAIGPKVIRLFERTDQGWRMIDPEAPEGEAQDLPAISIFLSLTNDTLPGAVAFVASLELALEQRDDQQQSDCLPSPEPFSP